MATVLHLIVETSKYNRISILLIRKILCVCFNYSRQLVSLVSLGVASLSHPFAYYIFLDLYTLELKYLSFSVVCDMIFVRFKI